MAKTGTINLLPQEEFEASILGRILRWATGSFRIIVIVTEMVVMGAFLSRFWLDAQNADLNDQIKVKSAQISSQKDLETTFRKIQTKLDIFKNLSATSQFSGKIDLISSKVPSDVVLAGLMLDSSGSDIKGTSITETSIAQFINNLKADKAFKTVTLESASSSQANPGQTDFLIKVTY